MEAGQLHQWVEEHNWDDGLSPMWPIAESPRTEFATALLMYWRLGGPWLEANPEQVNQEAARLQKLIREQLLAGFYSRGASRFDPSTELTKVQLYQLRKAGLPDMLLGSPGSE